MPAAPRRLIVFTTALALVAIIPTATAVAAGGIKETSRSTFTLLPDEGRVHAHATITLHNKRKPTTSRGPCKNAPRRTCRITTSYYTKGWGTIVVPPDAINVSVGGKGVEPFVISDDASGTAFAVRFPHLNYKKKQAIEIDYDLPDNGPGSQQRTRVTNAYARFCWYGEYTDTGSVKALLPAGWEAITTGGETTMQMVADGTTIATKGNKVPGAATLCTDAFRDGSMQRTHVVAPRRQLITLDAWPDDPDWTTEMTRVIEERLPALEDAIGSAMPFASLTIQQVARTNGFGHPSDLDTTKPRLLMDEDLDFAAAPAATLARSWFDDGSIVDPWLSEGLALWAGLSTTGYECPEPGEYPGEGPPTLREWHVRDDLVGDDPMLPVYLVSAACTVVEDIADAVGPTRMRTVIDSLRTGTPCYGNREADPRSAWRPAGWTDWLDAVDEFGLVPSGETDLGLAERALTTYGIAMPEELAGRFSARTLYHDSLVSMSGTALPAYVDAMMEAWSFDAAVPAILEAKRVQRLIADHPTLTDDARTAFRQAFEATPSADALVTLEATLDSWVPATMPA